MESIFPDDCGDEAHVAYVNHYLNVKLTIVKTSSLLVNIY